MMMMMMMITEKSQKGTYKCNAVIIYMIHSCGNKQTNRKSDIKVKVRGCYRSLISHYVLVGSAYLSYTHFSSFLLESLSSWQKDTRHLLHSHSHLEWHLWKSDYGPWICISKWIALNGWEMSWRTKHRGVATAFARRSLLVCVRRSQSHVVFSLRCLIISFFCPVLQYGSWAQDDCARIWSDVSQSDFCFGQKWMVLRVQCWCSAHRGQYDVTNDVLFHM